MTEQELNDQLDELGREVADLYPNKRGAVIFDVSEGELKGIRFEFKRRPTPKQKRH